MQAPLVAKPTSTRRNALVVVAVVAIAGFAATMHGDTSGLTWWVSIKYDEGEGCWEKYPYHLASA